MALVVFDASARAKSRTSALICPALAFLLARGFFCGVPFDTEHGCLLYPGEVEAETARDRGAGFLRFMRRADRLWDMSSLQRGHFR